MNEIKCETDDMEELDNYEGMSNDDGTIDEGFEEKLKENPNKIYGQHSAWNFCGRVWFNGEKFKEEIWRYRELVETIEADTLEELMEEANSRWGYE